MFKRMLRSVLVATFSAGLALGAVSTCDLVWGSAPAKATSVSALPGDLVWGVAPAGGGA